MTMKAKLLVFLAIAVVAVEDPITNTNPWANFSF
jgi:hypothetical protein